MFFRNVVTFVVLSFTTVNGSAGSDWSYEGATGPVYWGGLGYPLCASGLRQSPIDIHDVIPTEPLFVPLELTGDWDLDRPLSITNNGHTVQATVNGQYRSSGGPLLTTQFLAEQFHFHWGMTDDVGSEHTINGVSYPAEMHVVHYDSSRFHNVSEAMELNRGLAVFAFFIHIGEYNTAMQPIVEAISGLQMEQNRNLAAPFNIGRLLPDVRSYWSYSGSLTTPPCYESVIWTVFQTPIIISHEQMDAFRLLGDITSSHPIINNYRPTVHGSAVYNLSRTHHQIKY